MLIIDWSSAVCSSDLSTARLFDFSGTEASGGKRLSIPRGRGFDRPPVGLVVIRLIGNDFGRLPERVLARGTIRRGFWRGLRLHAVRRRNFRLSGHRASPFGTLQPHTSSRFRSSWEQSATHSLSKGSVRTVQSRRSP